MAGKPGRRGWGYIRQLPNKSRRFQASYVGPDLVRHYAAHTFTAKMYAEAWLAGERRLIELDEWTPPALRAAQRAVAYRVLGTEPGVPGPHTLGGEVVQRHTADGRGDVVVEHRLIQDAGAGFDVALGDPRLGVVGQGD